MKVSLIYAYWPNRPFGNNWCDLPLVLREAGLPEALHAAGHTVVEVTFFAEGDDGEELAAGMGLARDIGQAIDAAKDAGDFPVVLVGSCALAAIGVAASRLVRSETGVLWCDAHGDLNTPATSLTGLLEGMALTAACGRAWQAMVRETAGATPLALSNVALFGVRDLDPGEQALIDAEGIPIVADAGEAAAHLAEYQHRYVHLDMDVHDPAFLKASAYEMPGGPDIDTVREVIAGVGRLSVLSVSGLDTSALDGDAASKAAIAHISAVVAAQAQSAEVAS